jgi:hypothetical protein
MRDGKPAANGALFALTNLRPGSAFLGVIEGADHSLKSLLDRHLRKNFPTSPITFPVHNKSWQSLLEKDFSHHAFILMLQKMAMKQRHSANNRIGKIHYQIY